MNTSDFPFLSTINSLLKLVEAFVTNRFVADLINNQRL